MKIPKYCNFVHKYKLFCVKKDFLWRTKIIKNIIVIMIVKKKIFCRQYTKWFYSSKEPEDSTALLEWSCMQAVPPAQ